MNGIVAVSEHVARAGLIAWWRLSGEVFYDDLVGAWEERGLESSLLPSLPSPAAALARAMNGLRTGRTLVRPLDIADGARALVHETPTDSGSLEYDVKLRVRVDAIGAPIFDPPDHPDCARVVQNFQRALGTIDQHTVGAWLVKLVERCDGVRLRDTGGVYFVPETRVAEWKSYVKAIAAASSHRVNGVPALRGEDAVSSVLDAVEAEARAAAADLEAELEMVDLTARKAENRVKRCDDIKAKVERYEALLAERASATTQVLDELRARFAALTLATGDFGGDALLEEAAS